jgi:hypothetical protein
LIESFAVAPTTIGIAKMRWRSSGSSNNDRSSDSATGGGHDKDMTMSSSLDDDDEPDSGSQDPVHTDGSVADQHGRLGTSGSDLPPSAGHLLEKENMTSDEEKKQTNRENGSPPSAHDSSKSQLAPPPQAQSQAIIPHATGEDRDMEDDDDEDYDDDDEDDEDDDHGLDHSSLPDDMSETDTLTTPWKPQTTQSTCEFTHKIINYSQKRESGCKKAEYSATTVDEFGNRWRLIVYVNGNGRASNHHLSLFLQVSGKNGHYRERRKHQVGTNGQNPCLAFVCKGMPSLMQILQPYRSPTLTICHLGGKKL